MTPVVSERPTFEQAFAAEPAATDSLPVTPASESPTPDSASAATTEPPAAELQATTTPSPETKAGEPPKERWDDILANTRTKTRAEVEAEWKAYEWAKQVPKEQFDSMAQWYAKAQTNPVEFALSLVEELSADQQHAATLRSHAGRLLRSARSGPAEAQTPDLKPDIPVYDNQGQLVAQTFSADKVQSIVQHAVQQAITEHVQPLKQDAATRQRAEQQAEQQRQQHAFVASESARIQSAVLKLPKAHEHWTAIVEKAKTYADDLPVGEALRDAYFEVVLPTLTHAAKSEVLDSLKTKAAAGSVNPSGAVVASTKRPASFLDPSLKW